MDIRFTTRVTSLAVLLSVNVLAAGGNDLAAQADTGPSGPAYSALRLRGRVGDERTSIVYHETTGLMMVDAPVDTDLSSIRLDSRASIFVAEPALNLGGNSDIDLDDTIFREQAGAGFGSLSLGPVAPPHMPEWVLMDDLSVSGTTVEGTNLENVDLVYVPAGQTRDRQTSLIYDAQSGAVAVEVPEPTDLSSIRIGSSARIFTGEPALNLGGDFDLDEDDRIFKATFGDSFQTIDFGKVAQPGLAESFLQTDLSVVGTKKRGGGLGNVDLIYVPDRPSLSDGQFGDDQVSIIYDARTGRVMVEAAPDRELSWLSIDSIEGAFVQSWWSENLSRPVDAYTTRFVLKGPSPQGFGSINFGRIAVTGLAESAVRDDLFLRGNGLDGSGLGTPDLIYRSGTTPVSRLEPNGQLDDAQTSIVYDAGTGQLSVDAPAGRDIELIDIVSNSGIFRNRRAQNLDGPMDASDFGNLFKADFGRGFGSFDFGTVATVGLRESYLREDLRVVGNLIGGGDLGHVDLVYLASLRIGRVGDRQTSIVYDASTGRVMVDAPSTGDLTSLRVGSDDAIFTGAPAKNLGGDFDLDRDETIFKAVFGGSFGSLDFGKVAPPGLDETLLRRGLSIDGTFAGGGTLLDADLVYLPGAAATPGLVPGGQVGDDQTSIVYYSHTGRVLVDGAAEARFNSIDIESRDGVFTGEVSYGLDGPLDVDRDGNIYKAAFGPTFGSLDLGRVAATGLAESSLRDDLTVAGSLATAGSFGQADLVHVPGLALQAGGVRNDDRISLVYHAQNGLLSLDLAEGMDLTSLDILSASGVFNIPNPGPRGQLNAAFPDNVFETFLGDSRAIAFTARAQEELTESFLLDDLTVGGTLLGGGSLAEIDLLYIPGIFIQRGLLANGQVGDATASIVYDAATGRIMVDAPSGVDLTTVSIESGAAVFTGEPAQGLFSDFDIDRDDILFKSLFPPNSFGSLSFGKVAQTGIPESIIQSDLSVTGSRAGGGELGEVDLIYFSGSPAAPGIRPGGLLNDGQASVMYDANTGEVTIDAPAGNRLALLDIASAGGIFNGVSAQNLGGPFDADRDENLFKANIQDGFGSSSFGTVAAPRLPQSVLQRDLTVNGTLLTGGNLGPVDLVYVPDQSVTPGLQLGGQHGDQQTSVVYFAGTGRILIDAPAESELAWIDVSSENAIFTGQAARQLEGPTDFHENNELFKARLRDGFGPANLGKVAQKDLRQPLIQSDLTVTGSLMDGSSLGSVDLVYIPGPVVQPGLQPGGRIGDDRTSLVYFSHTGRVLLDVPADGHLSSVDIESTDGIFAGEPVQNVGGPFNVADPHNIFKATFGDGFGSFSLGRVAQTNLASSIVENDLTVAGSRMDGADFGGADLVYVPGSTLHPAGQRRDEQTSLVYDVTTGSLSLDAPLGVDLSSLDIVSAQGIFLVGEPLSDLDGPDDVATASNLFKLTFDGGFGSFSFGNVTQPGLPQEFLQEDLTVAGTLVDGSHLGNVDLVYLRSLLSGRLADRQTSIVYDAGTGRVMIDAPSNSNLTSVRIGSERAIFTGAPGQHLDGDFDLDEDGRIFRAEFGDSFGSFNLGKVAQPGLSEADLRSDLSVVGTLVGGNGLGDVDLIFVPGSPPPPGVQPGGQLNDEQTTIVYDASTGRVMIDAPRDVGLTSIDLSSKASVFTGRPARNLDGPFDADLDDNMFKADYGGRLASFSLGKVAAAELSESFVRSDLTAGGTLTDGGTLGNVDLLYLPPRQFTPGVQPGGQVGDDRTSLVYYASTGRVLLDAPNDGELTSIDIQSNASVFAGGRVVNLDGPFDEHSDDTLFKAGFDESFGSLNLGRVATANLAQAVLQDDLTVIGSRADGASLLNVDLVYIPGEAAQPGLQPGGVRGDAQTSIIYDVSTGNVSLDAPTDVELTSIDIGSSAGILTGNLGSAENLGGVFDHLDPYGLFKASFDGSFGSINLGEIARPNLDPSLLQEDLTVAGTLVGGGSLGPVDLVILQSLLRGEVGDGQTSIIYDANSGRVMVDAPNNRNLTSVFIQSTDAVFTGEPAKHLGGDFDVDQDDNIFKAMFEGDFGSLSFGRVAPPGLSERFVRNDLAIQGTRVGGRGLGNVDLVYIPGGPVAPGLQPDGRLADEQTSIVYYANSGRILVDAAASGDLTSIDIMSSSGIFTGRAARNVDGPFDEDGDNNIYKATFGGHFGSVSFGRVAQPGLEESFLRSDLTVAGSTPAGGTLGAVDIVYVADDAAAAGLQSDGRLGDSLASLVYFAGTGRLLLDVPSDGVVSSLEVNSAGALLTGVAPQNLDGALDSVEDDNLFKADFLQGFGSLNLGHVVQPGLDESTVQQDVTVLATLTDGSVLSQVDLAYFGGAAVEPGLQTGGQQGDDQSSIVYDANTGQISIDSPAGRLLAWVDIQSASGVFTGSEGRNLAGPFDVDHSDNIFKIHSDGFGSVTFGNVAPRRLTESFLQDDLTVLGMLNDGEQLGAVDLVYIPRVGGMGTTLYYNPDTGEIIIVPPEGTEFTSINLDSASGVFTNEAARNLGGSFDNDSDDNIFKATFGSSFSEISLGNVAQPGLTPEFLLNDLSIVGSLAGGGDMGDVEIVFGPPPSIPEPSTFLLLGLGLMEGLGRRAGRSRRRRRTEPVRTWTLAFAPNADEVK